MQHRSGHKQASRQTYKHISIKKTVINHCKEAKSCSCVFVGAKQCVWLTPLGMSHPEAFYLIAGKSFVRDA